MILRAIGITSIVLSLFAFYPSSMPGALSVAGFYLSLFSLILSAFASHLGKPIYFSCAGILSLANVLLVNDGTRFSVLFSQNDWLYTISMYGIYLVVLTICGFLVSKELLISGNRRI
ncbi:hypothetical protein ACSLBF_19665 (plasmid) [Pseudoalteromonas sp. T1lg65]|uniref:hypothetical protein n=1 Tax=Pseudoalteromonas sp. T1lg65 TaxID=2077101 RepID=UPI003F7A559D